MTAFYTRADDGLLVPGPLAAGPPWLPDTQHGSMIVALAARAVQLAPSAVPMQLMRLTVDLTRPVPSGPTDVVAAIARDGRRVQSIDIAVLVDGTRWARASALRMRTDEVFRDDLADVPPGVAGDAAERDPSDAVADSPLGPDPLWDAHEARWEAHEPGAGTVWLRPSVPLVENEALDPTTRVALVADLVMTTGTLLDRDRYVGVNADLTLALTRPPVGDWIRISSRVRVGSHGVGHSEGELADTAGRIGHVIKSVLVDRRR